MDMPSRHVSLGPQVWADSFSFRYSTLSGVSGGKLLLAADPNRYYLGFSIPGSASSTIVKPGSESVSGEGYLVLNQQPPLEFFYHLHGALPQQEWWVYQYSLSQPMFIIEGLWVPRSQ